VGQTASRVDAVKESACGCKWTVVRDLQPELLRVLVGGDLGLNAFVDFFAVNRNVFRSIDTESDLQTLYAQNGHGDLVTDVYAFADFAGEYQHNLFLDGLMKRLYQEAGVSLWVVVITECIQMRPSV